MKNKGFAITGIMYTILLLFIVLLVGMLVMLASRKSMLDSTRNEILNKYDNFKGKGQWSFEIEVTAGDLSYSFGVVDSSLIINWGDGSENWYLGKGYPSHTYGAPGIYEVTVTGTVSRISFCTIIEENEIITWDAICTASNTKLHDIKESIPKELGLRSAVLMFSQIDQATFTNTSFFDEASVNITNMAGMFYISPNFNQNISNWNTSNVTSMRNMFAFASKFNQPIGNWNTSKVTNMSEMFFNSEVFNQPIGNWNTSNVTNMSDMFTQAYSFNQPIGLWDTRNVKNMSYMFFYATVFNQNIGNWNTSNVTDMTSMFKNATVFNQNIGNWNTSKVKCMSQMFSRATNFNQPIGNWNTSNVTCTEGMFFMASNFNRNIGGWDTSKVTIMNNMFGNATVFNQDLSSWCVELIAAEQFGFKNNTPAWVLPKPIWGTCP